MEIPHDLRPAEPVARRRVASATDKPAPPGSSSPPVASADSARVASSGDVQRYVQTLKVADPTRLHKVEDLRARVVNGSYQADAEELADLILGPSDDSPSGKSFTPSAGH